MKKFVLTLALISLSSAAHAGTVQFSGPVDNCSMSKLVGKVEAMARAGDTNITVSIGNSDGGLLTAAIKTVEVLRRYNVNTYAHGECASSCTALYAGGRYRMADRSARFMFHGAKVASHKLKTETVGAISKDPCTPTAMKITKGEKLTKAEQNAYRDAYVEKWLAAIRVGSPALANELDRNDTLKRDDEKWYSAKAARKLGYVNY